MERISHGTPWAREDVEVRASRYVTGVYVWMAIGVAFSAVVGWGLFSTGLILDLFRVAGRGLMWGIFFIQLGAVLGFSGAVNRLNVGMARALYFVYAAVVGITLAFVGLIYTTTSIASTFALAAVAYGGLAVFGAVTKRNLGPVGTFCGMGLFMLFGLSIFAMLASTFGFLASWMETMNLGMGVIGVVVFSGLTAWESQKISAQAQSLARTDASGVQINSYVVHGAFMMYLNFINLFLSLLRLFGSRR